jgi:hypothetical protein
VSGPVSAANARGLPGDRITPRHRRRSPFPGQSTLGKYEPAGPAQMLAVGLELRNVVAKYPFERSHGFPGIQPNSGHGDYSRLRCGVRDTQLGLPRRSVSSAPNAAAEACITFTG